MFEKKIHAPVPLPFRTQRYLHGLLIAILFAGAFACFARAQRDVVMLVGALVSFAGVIPGRPTLIAVGADGVLLRWWWREEFVPMDRLYNLRPSGQRLIALVFADARSMQVSFASKRLFSAHRDRATWLDRVRTALAAYRARVPARSLAQVVGQGERSHADWLAALRRLRAGDAGYRDAVVPVEELWKVVEDPASGADARAGAALVLRGSLDEDGKERVRVAASATASPKLRVALDRTAAGASEAEIEAALEELAVEDEPRRVWSA